MRFLLILCGLSIILSSEVIWAMQIRVQISGDIWDNFGDTTIATGGNVTLTIQALNGVDYGDWKRLSWQTPFEFDGYALLNGPGYYSVNPTFESNWFVFHQMTPLNWNGSLPEMICYTGVSLEFMPMTDDFIDCMYFNFSFTDDLGDFCIRMGDPAGISYDWLFDTLQPTFDEVCWEVAPEEHYLHGNIKVKNYTTGEEEPLWQLGLDIGEMRNGVFYTLASTETNWDGYYFEFFPPTDSTLWLRLDSDINIFYRLITDPFGDPIVGLANTGIIGRVSSRYDLTIQYGIDYSSNGFYFPTTRMQQDMFNMDYLYLPDVLICDDIPIRIGQSNRPSYWKPAEYISMDIDDWRYQGICHEFGHQLMYELQDYTWEYSSDTNNHYYNYVSDTIRAFQEGFAEFINGICSIPESLYINGVAGNMEINSWWTGNSGTNDFGGVVEGAIASMLLDLFDDNDHPQSSRQDDDDVTNSNYMWGKILSSISHYALIPDTTQKTWSMRWFALRLLGDSAQSWYYDSYFIDLQDAICDILEKHHLIPFPGNKSGGLCGYADFVDDDIDDDIPIIPYKFELCQNYPNPFNSATQIIFRLPESDYCNLEIFNILGQIVWQSEKEFLDEGEHTIILDENIFNELSSGVYLYKLVSNNNIATRKMTLLK